MKKKRKKKRWRKGLGRNFFMSQRREVQKISKFFKSPPDLLARGRELQATRQKKFSTAVICQMSGRMKNSLEG